MSLFALLIIHALAASVIRRWKSFGLFVNKVAVYGSGEVAQKFIERISAQVGGRRIVGVFDDVAPGVTPHVVIAGGLSDLLRIGQIIQFDEVLIALPMLEQRRILNAVSQLSILPTNIRLCPDLVAFHLRPVGVVDYDRITLIELVRMPLDNWGPIFGRLRTE